jgi:hypothetical protein
MEPPKPHVPNFQSSFTGSKKNLFQSSAEPLVLNYQPASFNQVKEAKKQVDEALDNLNGIVSHVMQREEMKIKQHTKPEINQARLKILTQEQRKHELLKMDTSEH